MTEFVQCLFSEVPVGEVFALHIAPVPHLFCARLVTVRVKISETEVRDDIGYAQSPVERKNEFVPADRMVWRYPHNVTT